MSLRTKVEMHQWAFTVFPPLTAYLVSLQILLTESRNCAPPHGSSPLSLTWIIAVALDLSFLTLSFPTTVYIPPPQSLDYITLLSRKIGENLFFTPLFYTWRFYNVDLPTYCLYSFFSMQQWYQTEEIKQCECTTHLIYENYEQIRKRYHNSLVPSYF